MREMTLLSALQWAGAAGTILTGLISLFWPLKVQGFTGLTAPGSRGITEIRSILGGLFVGLGAAVLYLGTPDAYWMLGVMYLAIGIVRAVSMAADRSVESSNLISLAVEVVFGIILVIR